MSKTELDAIDRELLARLQANAREPTASLARHVGLSRSAIQERVHKLEKLGIIQGYRAIVAWPGDSPLASAQALISIEPKKASSIVKKLEGFPEISRCYTVSGEFDLLVEIRAPLLEDVDAVLDEIGEIDGVHKTKSSILLAARFER